MNIRETLAQNVRAYRLQAGLTQEQLAQKSGLHRTYVGKVEQQRANISLTTLQKIAKTLDVAPMLLVLDHDSTGKPLFNINNGDVSTDSDTDLCNCAFVTWDSNGALTMREVTLDDEDLSIQVMATLVKLGVPDAQLFERYQQIWPRIQKAFNIADAL